MTTENLPSIATLKAQAKRLRQALSWDGVSITHGRALEITALTWGYRDWNTLHATASAPIWSGKLALGDRLTGDYMGHPFEAELVGATAMSGGYVRVNLRFAEAVDVVQHESFSALRKQVTAVVGPDGRSRSKTSDGTPHMVLRS